VADRSSGSSPNSASSSSISATSSNWKNSNVRRTRIEVVEIEMPGYVSARQTTGGREQPPENIAPPRFIRQRNA